MGEVTANERAYDKKRSHEGRFICAPRTACVRTSKGYLHVLRVSARE